MRFKVIFSYDGSDFMGFQKQPKKRTVQGELEKILKKINSDHKVEVYGSGRTDRGVHAYNQVCHFDLKKTLDPEKLKVSMNSLLMGDIYIKSVEKTTENFDARRDAKAKEYIYKINLGEYNPNQRKYVYQYNKRLDLPEIERGLKYLEGEHNFKSFTSTDEPKESYVRKIIQTNLIRNNNNIEIIFLGTGFMKYMVRNMVGTLIEIGEGKKKSEDLINILKKEDRTKAGVTAEPQGLYLNNVFY